MKLKLNEKNIDKRRYTDTFDMTQITSQKPDNQSNPIGLQDFSI